ncbi:hypothetical protein NGRA_1670 [Nosema granulosis]|uniref:Uncharacterized protein n=1 Tax=Nosema granulosis TaxID=83296 RepID=A0A9P6GZ28_9MICR|nr:hypothetical protein NGRA_1670 [Nosema granulosis]
MRNILKESTNLKRKRTPGKIDKKEENERANILSYLKEKMDKSSDCNLQYDLHLCMEILEGKENQLVKDLKQELQGAIIELEDVTAKSIQLEMELENLSKE